ncbi:MAG TPA: F0F1 ATP synthase subunit B [Mesotoga infera]|uniref:ATP synthase subunit b n=2 Tax=Bacteria TaxID=2 RepID=A0A7Z7LHL4_9BACT|nr:F0F1 ATP synthase subunit B [Mesotoga infera]MBP8660798.1 F0F1 ATP synthase subunit B [Mesotoga sp.]SSC13700.1 ATP synthase subunit b [Mesotoga infera]HNS66396.1 F0F1 ATP synthase subunit B [Mesotoga infera]HOI34089.1 F0F1 ATP synthase subunit B [Mesotoga infera]HOI63012.1 F0F1 ATP synthase subunit B [Mesotoga sp.]
MIEINLTAVLSILNFLLLYFVLKKVLFDKFFDIIKQRKEKIKGEIAQAEKLRKEANALKEEYTRKMDEARTASDEMLSRAERQSEEIVRQAREKAQQEIQRMYQAAEIQINQEREKAMEDVKGAVVASAVTMVGRFLQKEMDETARKQYARRILESLGDQE